MDEASGFEHERQVLKAWEGRKFWKRGQEVWMKEVFEANTYRALA